MTTHEVLHIIRNPWGWSEDEVRAARLAAADLIEQQAKEIEALRGFAQEVMNYWPEGWGMEGDQIQKAAADHGLLEPETRTERCGENCGCDIDSPVWVCYRKTKLLTGQ